MATRHELAQAERDRDTALNEHLQTMADTESAFNSTTDLLTALTEAIDWEAGSIAERRQKGWQTASRAHVAAAEIVRAWRERLISWTPPTPAPDPTPVGEPTDTRDAQGIGIDNRTKAGESLDDRLAAAFGPAAAPVRHIRTVIETSIPHEMDSFGNPTYGALCGAAGGSWTSPGGSNCKECHLRYMEQNDGKPYDGPGHVDVAAILGMPADTMAVISPEDAVVVPPSGVDDPAQAHVDAPPDAANVYGGTFRHSEPPTSAVAETIEANQIGPVDVPDAEITGPAVRFYDPGELEPRKLTLTEISARGRALNRGADHRSYSQVNEFEQCGARYALASETAIPAWWNVGGTAFHNAAMAVNLSFASDGNASTLSDPATVGAMWSDAFRTEVERVQDETCTDPEQWRIANRGMENGDWWRVEGEHMLTRYVAWLQRMYADGWRVASDVDGKPLIEAERTFYVQSAPWVKVDNVIDLVLTRPPSNLDPKHAPSDVLIIDLKSGAKLPTSTLQLAFYYWALVATTPGGLEGARVRGCYYAARRGETTAPSDVSAAYPWHDLATRIVAMDQQERAGLYLPRPNMFCRSCPARTLCPEGPR